MRIKETFVDNAVKGHIGSESRAGKGAKKGDRDFLNIIFRAFFYVKRSEISKVITIGLHAPRVTTFRRLMIFCTASITGSAA